MAGHVTTSRGITTINAIPTGTRWAGMGNTAYTNAVSAQVLRCLSVTNWEESTARGVIYGSMNRATTAVSTPRIDCNPTARIAISGEIFFAAFNLDQIAIMKF